MSRIGFGHAFCKRRALRAVFGELFEESVEHVAQEILFFKGLSYDSPNRARVMPCEFHDP